MFKYTYYPTHNFIVRLEKIKRRDPLGHSRIESVIGRLLENPNTADGRMHGISIMADTKNTLAGGNIASFTTTVNCVASRTNVWKKNADTAKLFRITRLSFLKCITKTK